MTARETLHQTIDKMTDEQVEEVWRFVQESTEFVMPFKDYDEANDLVIGLFSGPTDLSTTYKQILRDEIDPRSGWTQKDKL